MKAMKNLTKTLKKLNENLENEDLPSKKELESWIGSHLNFKDKELHSWAEENSWNIHRVEEMVYKLASDHVKECLKKDQDPSRTGMMLGRPHEKG